MADGPKNPVGRQISRAGRAHEGKHEKKSEEEESAHQAGALLRVDGDTDWHVL